jgi:bifunctional DNA primase/polymerase-like protein/primase-like protein/D5-like protein
MSATSPLRAPEWHGELGKVRPARSSATAKCTLAAGAADTSVFDAEPYDTGIMVAFETARGARPAPDEQVAAPPGLRAAQVDAGDHSPGTMLQAALEYAQAGFRVFPVHAIRAGACSCGGGKGCAPGKHPIGPLVPKGVKDASVEVQKIEAWWSRVPDANIGIATGATSDLVVLDVDGPLGEQTLTDFETRYGALPRTRQVKTGKGRHLYFRYPAKVTHLKSVARKNLGLDVRGDGGYVVAPPSLHASGRRYEFEVIDASIAECPTWVVDYANDPLDRNQRQTLAIKTTPAAGASSHSEHEEARLRSALAVIPAAERDTWLNTGMALHSLGWGTKGLEIWSDWSRTIPEKHDAADQERTWGSFDRPYQGTRISVGTLYRTAHQHGWVDETRQTEHHTDLGNAKRLVARHGENIRFVPEWEKWIIWSDGRWQLDGDGAIMRLAKETVEAIYSEATALDGPGRDALLKHAMKSQAEARLRSMIGLAESEADVVLPAARLLRPATRDARFPARARPTSARCYRRVRPRLRDRAR